MANRRVFFGSCEDYSDEWFTPRSIVTPLGEFDLDPCAGPMKHARRNIRRPKCGLAAKWKGRVWLNPPYSNVHLWTDRLIEHGDGIALVNARTDPQWFQRLAHAAAACLWLKGRIKFERPDGAKKNPPCGSVLVAIGEHNADALLHCGLPGFITVPPLCLDASVP